jgi:AraC-like DNA-binding protein
MDQEKEFLYKIYHTLFLMATGTLEWDIELERASKDSHEIEQSLVLVSKKLLRLQKRVGVLSPYFGYENGFYFCIVLTSDFRIVGVSHKGLQDLGYDPKELYQQPLSLVLDQDDQKLTEFVEETLKEQTETSFTLHFQTKNRTLFTSKGTFTTLPNSGNLLLVVVKTIQKVVFEKIQVVTTDKSQVADFQKMQEVCQYIINHYHLPLPTTRDLAKMFQTNECTLKKLFRDYGDTSIYQFYTQERLKNAHALIEHTQLSLSQIALNCGFNDYPSFLVAFKKKYNYAPSQLKRPS